MKKIITLLIISSLSYLSFGQHPTNLQATNLTSNSVDLSWDESMCNSTVNLKYRITGSASSGWTNFTGVSYPYLLTGLIPATSYQIYVKCVGISGWSNPSYFTTLDSINCNLNTSIIINNSTCDGSYDGSASITAFNGTPPYSYLWDNNDTTSSINSIPNNTYIVTITDSLACSKIDTILVEFDNLISLSQFVSVFTDTSRLEFPNTLQSYQVWAYDTLRLLNNGCNVNIRPEFIISHQNTPIQLGQIMIQWQSPFGFATIPYSINNDGEAYGFFNTASSDSTGINAMMGSINEILLRVKFQGQAPYGTYSAIWNTKEVDALGNIIQTITQNDTTSLTLVDCNSFQSNISQSNISCWGDSNGISSIDSIINGSGNYTYNWVNDIDQTITLSTNDSIGNLSQGDYSCTIIDSNWGCSLTSGISISEPIALTIIENTTDVSCFGDSNGVAILNISGGTNPYGEGWNGNNTTNLQAGIYAYTVTDAIGCTLTDSVHIIQPDELNSSINSLDITNCGTNDGIINLSVNGGTGTYSYIWSNNDTTEDLYNLSSGIYSVTITDNNNCSATNSTSINNFNTTLTTSLISPTYNGYNIQCFGGSNGSISSNTNGGVGPLTYNWSNGQNTSIDTNLSAGLYILIITDSLNCTDSDSILLSEPNELTSTYTQTNASCFGINDGGAIVNFFGGASGSSNGDTTYILGWSGTPQPVYLPYPQINFNTSLLPPPYNAIPAGIYPYTVTDLNSCVIYDTIIITEPDSLYITYSLSNNNGYNVSCFGGNNATLDIQVNGGTNPFDNYLNSTLQAGLISNNLSAGNYTNSIVDLNGCTANTSITLNQPNQLNTTLNTINISCYDLCDGEIYSDISGGVFPYYYSWSNTLTNSNISNLCNGNYSLTLTDENGCTQDASTIINSPNAISVSIDSTLNINNYGGNSGFIYITTNGGIGLLNTNWTSTNNYLSTNNDILNLYADIYYLEVIDSNLCSYLDTFELSQPSSLGISISTITNPSCYDSCNGEININAYGGDSTYSYLWSGPSGFTSNNDNINNLCNGEYIIIIDDGITTFIDTITIYQPQPITTLLSVDSIICHNGTAQAEINVWGGSQPFTYSWSNGDTNYYTIVNSGNHSIDISDINGCSYSQSYSLSNPDSIYTQTISTNTSCFGGNNGSISINITNGGVSPYNFSNDNGLNYQISNTYTNLLAGNYSFLISDINGCLGSASAELTEPSAIISTTTAIDVSCFSYCDGSVAATALGGNSPYSYSWNNGTNNLCPGFYNVIVTDINGCIVSNSAIVNEPNPLIINISIDGNNIIATNGFTSYQWYNNDNNPINGETDSIFTPLAMGVYYVTVTDTNGCSSDSYYIEYAISTIKDYSSSINIFPNPTNGNITVNSEYGIKTIGLYNTIGNQLLSVNNHENKITETQLDLSTFAKGVYFIKMNIDNQIINQRIILQ